MSDKMKKDFMGLDGFVWFTGEIEDIADPLACGRCRVRVHGWHSENLSILPTKDLPWAQPMLSINCSKTWMSPLVGDWVLGFFMDGENAQFPVMLGVLPYIKPE